jgi:hypothetical protein
MTSPDGITWTIRTSAADNFWNAVIYANSLFVAVANSGSGNRVMTSPDGITWTSRTSAADNEWVAITYGNGVFVASAINATTGAIMYSHNGITWTLASTPALSGGTAPSYYEVSFGNGLFVAFGNGGGNRSIVSYDGITWMMTNAQTGAANGGCYGNGVFVSVATNKISIGY